MTPDVNNSTEALLTGAGGWTPAWNKEEGGKDSL